MMAEDKAGWHLSKGLSVSHILSTAVIAVGFFTYVTDIEQKTMINEIAIKSIAERMDRTEKRHSEEFGEIKEMLKHLTVKIDNLGHRRER
mgnify:FL=1